MECNSMIPTVLIVDDDLKLLKMLQRTLTYESLKALTASNGKEALQIMSTHTPDLIILDWMMPKMDGLAFMQRLRDEAFQTMVLMLTARDAIEDRGVHISVQDHGQGISADELTHVFDRFYSGDEEPIAPGFGLGLPIAKALTEGMGGSIAVESELGRGNIVTLRFQAANTLA